MQSRAEKWVLDLIRAAYIGEFGADPEQQSALNLLTFISTETSDGFHIFGESDEAFRIRGGSARLPERLLSAIVPEVPVWMGLRLIAMTEKGGGMLLTFTRESENNRTAEVLADRVILAVPFPILRDVEGISSLGLRPVKLKAINELGMGRNAKLMLSFSERFWRNGLGGVPAHRGGVFTDLGGAEFWETSRGQSGNNGILTHFLGGSAANTDVTKATTQAMNILRQIYSGRSPDKTLSPSLFKSWEHAPLARGSYSTLLTGQWTTLLGAAQEPELGGRLIFAGEQCSENFSGYMNGAVEAGNPAARALTSRAG